MNTTFDTWLAKQFTEGLVDIKFAVVAGKGVSLEAIQKELLVSEAAIGMRLIKSAPQATSMMPEHISQFVGTLN